MPIITVSVDDALNGQMEKHPKTNWSEVTRQAIRNKIEKFELMDQLTAESQLTGADIDDIATKINKGAHRRIDRKSE